MCSVWQEAILSSMELNIKKSGREELQQSRENVKQHLLHIQER